MKDDVVIGNRIRTIRESLSMTRERFAELIDISSSFLSQIERGDKSMSLETLMVISSKTGYSCDYILFGDATHTAYVDKINKIILHSPDNVAELMYDVIRPLTKLNTK